MRKPKLRELREAIRAFFKGPYTTKFPAEPCVPVEGFRGAPKYHEEDCIGCCACAEVCPAIAIKVTDDVKSSPPMRTFELNYGNCIFCGQCQLNCTTEKGIMLSKEYDLAGLDKTQHYERVQKELVLCEMCGAIVGARDHLKWIARQLGAKQYANPTLLLIAQEEDGLVGKESTRPDLSPQRSDMIRILCPKCRRDVVLREIWG